MAAKFPSLLLILLQLSLLRYRHCLTSASAGFSLKLVQRYFPNSNSFHQRLDSYATYQETDGASESKSWYFPDTIRPRITRSSNFMYTIEANIGTPSAKKTFIFDPGSELTWTQCTPCINCFNQDYPLFDPRNSTSYRKLPQNHPSARFFRHFGNGDFLFYLLYGSGESASGIVSVDTFSFPSHGKAYERIEGISTLLNWPNGLKISATFLVLPAPVDSRINTTILRFGNDVKSSRALRETSFLKYNDYNYRVSLLDISVGGRRLNLPNGTFPSGCMLDIGCSGSYLETHAYNEMVRVLMQHFSRFNLSRIAAGSSSQGQLCYWLRRGFSSFPSMTFHFQGANFEIGPKSLFQVRSDRFCLTMFANDNMTILGAFQQQNVRFVYDIGNQKVLFGKEDCSRDTAQLHSG
ncbi:Aspartic proteinase nepenthesin-1 [Sesamum angolense]|uniref:Aspartic proteinase nepenthesin-1 n=1 Tax=Sesamum angolense TaxID=2727404 RepID=A0AAE1WRD7_9LAMI|nr:Aspartic proteinase nepenthesin-1 [Sesamum angolense]